MPLKVQKSKFHTKVKKIVGKFLYNFGASISLILCENIFLIVSGQFPVNKTFPVFT